MRPHSTVLAIGALVVLASGCGPAGNVAGSTDDVAAQPERVSEATDDTTSGEHMGDTASEHTATAGGEHSESGQDMFAFGAPADPVDADRVVDVETVEEGGFHYEPDTIEVRAGETVTFRVHNIGEAVHEFVVGDEAAQATHEAQMRAMASEGGMMHDDPNAISVRPGETGELTWAFTKSTAVVYGCHEPGHFAAGMRGEFNFAG